MFLRAKRSKHTFSLPRHQPTPTSKNFEDENYFFSFRNGWNVYRNVVCPDVYRHSSTTSHFPFLPHLTLYLLLLVLIKRIFLYLSIYCCCYCYVATHSMNRNIFFFKNYFYSHLAASVKRPSLQKNREGKVLCVFGYSLSTAEGNGNGGDCWVSSTTRIFEKGEKDVWALLCFIIMTNCILNECMLVIFFLEDVWILLMVILWLL